MNKFAKSITKDELNELPVKSFEGNIHVIDTKEKIIEAVKFLENQKVIGFDTETKPVFKKGQRNGVSILQLSSENDAFIFKLKLTKLPKSLKNILNSKEIIKIGVAIKDDIIALKNISDFEPNSFIELQHYVKKFEIQNYSLQKLTAIVLGFKISKSKRLSNWESEILIESQLKYAATDAWASLMVYKELYEFELIKDKSL
ncbi:MAG: 3'-5' exonuclease domain-containing protein 2 [Bacteroidales bacterium]|nr:3'-5' exonuclease domain-containing protein 2 [Bacteroidales bacterium]MBN2757633.1 3'-5' exonuclease domain-containing protein 2 [Bacteroidales bacterium]